MEPFCPSDVRASRSSRSQTKTSVFLWVQFDPHIVGLVGDVSSLIGLGVRSRPSSA